MLNGVIPFVFCAKPMISTISHDLGASNDKSCRNGLEGLVVHLFFKEYYLLIVHFMLKSKKITPRLNTRPFPWALEEIALSQGGTD